MKRQIFHWFFILLSSIILFGCDRKVDNLGRPPIISIKSTDGKNKPLVNADIQVLAGSNVLIPVEIFAEGELEQVDYKLIGIKDYQALDANGKPLQTQSVPYDWNGLQSVRTGFQTSKEFKFTISIPNDIAVSYLTVQAFDKNKLKSFKTVTITPFQSFKEVPNVLLFSQNATDSDAGGKANKKLYLSSAMGITYDSLSAIANSLGIDISYADSSGTPILVSPEDRVAATDSSVKVTNLKNSETCVFVKLPIDYADISAPGQFFSFLIEGKLFVTIQSGKTYAFKNSKGIIGVIKINSITDGVSSSVKNASVSFNYKIFMPIAPPN